MNSCDRNRVTHMPKIFVVWSFTENVYICTQPCACACLLSHVLPFVTLWTVAHQISLSIDSPGKNTGVGGHVLLQRTFLTQGSNPGLQHCRQILYCLSPLFYSHLFVAETRLFVLQNPHISDIVGYILTASFYMTTMHHF